MGLTKEGPNELRARTDPKDRPRSESDERGPEEILEHHAPARLERQRPAPRRPSKRRVRVHGGNESRNVRIVAEVPGRAEVLQPGLR